MSEGYELEPYHVPQQSRREKLRETAGGGGGGCSGILPLYDASLFPSSILTDAHHHHHNNLIKEESSLNFMGFVGLNNTAFFSSSSSSSSSSASTSSASCSSSSPLVSATNTSQLLLDLSQSSIPLNLSCNHQHHQHLQQQQEAHMNHTTPSNSNPFFYAPQLPQSVRDFDPSAFEAAAAAAAAAASGLSFKPTAQALSYAPHDVLGPTGQGLSLSLSSHCRNAGAGAGISNYAVRDLSGGVLTQRNSLNSVPIGPFTGYSTILKGSRFLKPAQQLLEEFCDVGRRIYADRSAGETSSSAAAEPPEMESLSESSFVDEGQVGLNAGGGERRRMKARLISMLNEVYRRYKHYYQQLQAVVTSFEAVAGLSNAAPYTCFAISAMSKHFRCLKNAITDQIHSTSKALNEEGFGKEENKSFGLIDQGMRQPKLVPNLTILDQPHVWRPQRGLPERAVAVLKAWLFEHFLHPYPTDADKQMLAKQTGLSRNQVSNWFINARVRLWKPMVEEIHTLEMRQAQKATSEGENKNSNQQSKSSVAPALHMDKQPQDSTTQKNQDPPPLKRYRNELAQLPDNCDEPVNFSYENVSSHHGVGVGVSLASGNGDISLTLGLRQNNGGGLSQPLPLPVAHFALEESSNSYMMGGFESQNRHYGRDIGGQLLRDFVG